MIALLILESDIPRVQLFAACGQRGENQVECFCQENQVECFCSVSVQGKIKGTNTLDHSHLELSTFCDFFSGATLIASHFMRASQISAGIFELIPARYSLLDCQICWL